MNCLRRNFADTGAGSIRKHDEARTFQGIRNLQQGQDTACRRVLSQGLRIAHTAGRWGSFALPHSRGHVHRPKRPHPVVNAQRLAPVWRTLMNLVRIACPAHVRQPEHDLDGHAPPHNADRARSGLRRTLRRLAIFPASPGLVVAAYGKTLAAALALGILSTAAASAADGPDDKLRIGTEGTYPPFNYLDDAGRFTGFDVDIALALCTKMDIQCEFVQQDWEGLIPALQAGRFDMIAASMSITAKRRLVVSFTDRYYSNIVRFVARNDAGFDPANPAGKTIGASPATVASDWLQQNLADVATIRLYAEFEELLGDFIAGRLDAVFGDGLGWHVWLESPEGDGFAFVGEGYRLDEGIGIAVRKDDPQLLRRLNEALRAILEDGTYEKINARYFPFSIY